MKYNYRHVRVSDIPEEGIELQLLMDNDSLNSRINTPIDSTDKFGNDCRHLNFKTKIPVNVNLEAMGSTVFLKSSVSTFFETECRNCLKIFSKDFLCEISVVLKPQGINNNDIDDRDYYHYQGEVLDVVPILEEEIILGIPDFSVCSKDCKGLCSYCGINLNIKNCNCLLIKNENENMSAKSPFSKLGSLLN